MIFWGFCGVIIVYRQLEKYNGDVRSLALKSRRPHNSPNAHTKEELALIRRMLKRNGVYGLAEVFIRCKKKGYKRSFVSMCRLNVYDFQATEIDTIKLQELEKRMGFPMRRIQVDNRSEFVNDGERTE